VATEYSGSGDPRRTIELLWGVRARRRGPKPKLDPDQVIRSAIHLADREGLEAVTMRRVADELGVSAMSLYGYVPSKAELLDVMVDRVYGELPEPNSMGPGWRDRLEAVARQNWALHLAHPWLLRVAKSRPVLGPNLTARYDHELRAIDGLGLTDVEMDLIVSLVDDYVDGAVRGAVEAAHAHARTGMTDLRWWEIYGPLLGEVVDPERYPTAVRVGTAAGTEYGAAHDPARSFEFGLERVLDGISAFIQNPKSLR
jgi:AcrR family transcriptional regulator